MYFEEREQVCLTGGRADEEGEGSGAGYDR